MRNNVVKFNKRSKRIKNKKARRKLTINPLAVLLIVILLGSLHYLQRNQWNVDILRGFEVGDAYSNIYDGIMKYETNIPLYKTVDDDGYELLDTFSSVLLDHPEIFWLTGGGTLTPVGNVSYLETDTRCNMSNVPEMYEMLESVVKEIVDATERNCNTDYEKALFVHDLLITNCEYDEETYQKYSFNVKDSSNLAYSSYGCLVDRRAVCDGYARAYMLIMNRLGIECGYVYGNGYNSLTSGPHAWNYINIDGKYYMVDVTWDDPVGGDNTYISRDYFGLDYEEMGKDHVVDSNCKVPFGNS